MTQRVAILGLGTMGMGMAINLLKAGFAVTAYNRTQSKGASLAAVGARIVPYRGSRPRGAGGVVRDGRAGPDLRLSTQGVYRARRAAAAAPGDQLNKYG